MTKRDPATAVLSSVRYEFVWPDGTRNLVEYTPAPETLTGTPDTWEVRVSGQGGPSKNHTVRMQWPTMENARKLAARFGR